METLLKVQIDVICAGFLVIASISIERRAKYRRGEKARDIELFRYLMLSTYAMLFLDAVGWILDGAPGLAGRIALYTVNSFYFAVHPIPTALYILYADYQVKRDSVRLERRAKIAAAAVSALAVFVFLTPLTKLIFHIDEANRYVRGPFFPFMLVIFYSLVGFSLVAVVLGRKKAGIRVFRTLIAYPLMATVAAAFQGIYYGLAIFWPTTCLFIVAAAINIQRRRGSLDHLTGTANRRCLDEELQKLFGGAAPPKDVGGILVDLDDFKAINDSLGHDAGDRALEDAAVILKSAVRQDDLVARYGGDEFVIVMRDCSPESLADVVSRLRDSSAAYNASAEKPYRLSFSVGASLYDRALDASSAAFLSRLDAEMYVDKIARK